jgi:carbon storage regulator
MLVLSRKRNESIHIGNQVFVRVVEITGNRVRLGIEAPRSVHVLRGELSAIAPRNRSDAGKDGVDPRRWATIKETPRAQEPRPVAR